MGVLIAILFALVTVGCGSSSPTAPTPSVIVPPIVPPIISVIEQSLCPAVTSGVDLVFYREIGCNAFEMPLQGVRRWTQAPKLYLRTLDEAGAAIDTVTLDTVAAAMTETAAQWTAGRFSLAIERGAGSREGQTGWVTVKWPATADAAPSCGRGQVAIDGGWIELNYKVTSCACNGSAIRPRTARHELGHAFGYWHTDSANDLMSGLTTSGCDAGLSARELQAAAYQYR